MKISEKNDIENAVTALFIFKIDLVYSSWEQIEENEGHTKVLYMQFFLNSIDFTEIMTKKIFSKKLKSSQKNENILKSVKIFTFVFRFIFLVMLVTFSKNFRKNG